MAFPTSGIDPKEILQDFLVAQLTDPKTRLSSNSDSFDGNGSTKEFTMTPTANTLARAVTSVTVDAATQNKWDDYDVDLKNQKVIFNTAPGAGTDNVVVNYKEGGTSWIFLDLPREDLGTQSFPRMRILTVTQPDFRVGAYNSDLHSTIHLQVDCWTRSRNSFTISGRSYNDIDLAYYLLNQARLAFKNSEDVLYPRLHSYKTLAFRELGFDNTHRAYHGILEFQIQGTNIGE